MIDNTIKTFKQYNIDLINDNILQIKDIKIPNFYKNNYSSLVDQNILQWEFCHLISKLYLPYLYNNNIHYEINEYLINNNDIVFDCGANLGLFAAYAAAKGAKVYCFEPMTLTRIYLKETQKLYPNNIIIIPYALSDCVKQDKFLQCDNPGASHLKNIDINIDNKVLYQENVKCTTIDTFSKNNNIIPTFIKIDVEGSETLLLNGAKQILQYKPIISLGLYHKESDIYTIPQLIININNNYTLKQYKGDNSNYLYCY